MLKEDPGEQMELLQGLPSEAGIWNMLSTFPLKSWARRAEAPLRLSLFPFSLFSLASFAAIFSGFPFPNGFSDTYLP